MWMCVCPVCNAEMFTYSEEPKIGEPVKSEHATLLNGEKPKPGDSPECPNGCHKLGARAIFIENFLKISE